MGRSVDMGKINRERVTDLLIEYCRTDSAPLKERQLFDLVKQHFERLGFSVQQDDAGARLGGQVGNMIARKDGHHADDRPPLMFSAHLDRVAGGIGVKPVLQDGAVASDGTTILGADDAAGIAAIVEACTVLDELQLPHPPLEIVLTIGEEIGLVGAKEFDVKHLRAAYGYVLDASGAVGTVITQAPTQYGLTATFYGRAAHAGVAPEKGVSAIKMASSAVSRMGLGRIDHETTANVGYIAGGGPTNIVPERAEIRAETRSLNPSKAKAHLDRMVQAIHQAAQQAGGKAECATRLAYEGFRLEEDSAVVTHLLKAMEIGQIKPTLTSTGGGSDANVFNAKGMPTAVLGVGYEAIHTYREHMPISELVRLSRLVLALTQVDM